MSSVHFECAYVWDYVRVLNGTDKTGLQVPCQYQSQWENNEILEFWGEM